MGLCKPYGGKFAECRLPSTAAVFAFDPLDDSDPEFVAHGACTAFRLAASVAENGPLLDDR